MKKLTNLKEKLYKKAISKIYRLVEIMFKETQKW